MKIIRLNSISDLATFLAGIHASHKAAEHDFPEARDVIDDIKAKAYSTEDKSTAVIDELTKALFGYGAPAQEPGLTRTPVEEPSLAKAPSPAYTEPTATPYGYPNDTASATITISLWGPRGDVEDALMNLRDAIETEISFLKNEEGRTDLQTSLNISLHTVQ